MRGVGEGLGAGGHVDRPGEVVVDLVGLGEQRVQARLQLVHLRFDGNEVEQRCLDRCAGDDPAGDRVDLQIRLGGFGFQRGQVGLDLLDARGRALSSLGHRQGFVAVSVEVPAGFSDRLTRRLGGVPAPSSKAGRVASPSAASNAASAWLRVA